MTDGVYLTLNEFKQYLIGTIAATSGNTTVYNGNVSGTPDDAIMSEAIADAEATFNMECGSAFGQQTYSNVQSFITFVDGQGWLNLFARERGPVTAVASVQYRDLSTGSPTWQTVTFDADNIILPAVGIADGYPRPDAWHVKIYPTPLIPPLATGLIQARWSYTGGFATIPNSLKFLIASAAAYGYKRREVPFGMIQNNELGTFSRPMDYPPDILRKFRLWQPVYA